MSTYTLTCGSVVHPTVEGALNAVFVFDLTAYAEVGAHVEAVALEGVELALVASEEDDVVAVDVDGLDPFPRHFLGCSNVVPTIGERRGWLSQILALDVVDSLDQIMRAAELEVIEQVDSPQKNSNSNFPEELVLAKGNTSFK